MSDSASTQAAERNFSSPDRECDLVMKGGLTSGVVYPPVILELATKYRFRNIGGTSAGAIAAAATAAAEYGRASGRGQEAFQTLNQISQDLSSCLVPAEAQNQDPCDVSFLLNLFQPTAETKPLFDIALTWLKKEPTTKPPNRFSTLFRVLRLKTILKSHLGSSFDPGATLGLVVALAIALGLTSLSFWTLSLFNGQPSGIGFLVLLLAYGVPLVAIARPLGGIIAAITKLWTILTKDVVQNNLYGLCTGMDGIPFQKPGKALTNWLHEDVINKLANKPLNQPLTFDDLSNVEAKSQRITLRMVTCNLSHNRPYQLPFQKAIFIFHEDEFAKLFPPAVVDYLKCSAPPMTMQVRGQTYSVQFTDKKYHVLPTGNAMPVLVATRMSLSFPILFSAVPLYTIAASCFFQTTSPGDGGESRIEVKPEDLQRNWFSDGGIASNFPIHFFDAWMPGRPTFGLNLTTLKQRDDKQNVASKQTVANLEAAPQATQFSYVPEETTLVEQPEQSPKPSKPERYPWDEPIHLPKANEVPYPLWKDLNGNWLAFLGAMFDTSQSYRDTMQAMLPSYRERIVQIRLANDEGGLNLAMPPATIQALKQRGHDAGSELLEKFYPPGTRLQHHQWVRLKVMVGLLEKQLDAVAAAVRHYQLNYHNLLNQQKDLEADFPFAEIDVDWNQDALERLQELEELIKKWQARKTGFLGEMERQPVPETSLSRGFAQTIPLTEETLELRVTPDL
jgi:predicted acylesterase/phospholipase RssA